MRAWPSTICRNPTAMPIRQGRRSATTSVARRIFTGTGKPMAAAAAGTSVGRRKPLGVTRRPSPTQVASRRASVRAMQPRAESAEETTGRP